MENISTFKQNLYLKYNFNIFTLKILKSQKLASNSDFSIRTSLLTDGHFDGI